MAKLTYRDIPLLQTAGAELASSRTAWWMKDVYGRNWYVKESDDNQYLEFSVPNVIESQNISMSRQLFAELFEHVQK